MKPSKELYDLIKSMSGSEKRYFKLNVSLQKGNKNYLILFNAIEKQKIFDESELRNILKQSGGNIGKNLTITKNYLYKLIIKVLTQFRNESSIDLKLNLILSKCKLMYEKGLFSQYFKTVKTGKEAALKYERFTVLLDFIELEKNLIKKNEIGRKNLNDVYEHESEVLEWIRQISHYKKIVSELFTIKRLKGVVRDFEAYNKVTGLSTEINRFEKKKKLPALARDKLLLAKYLVCSLKGEFEESIKFCKLRYNLVTGNPDVFRDQLLSPKLDSLELHINSALKLKKFSEAKSVFAGMKRLAASMGDYELRLTDFDIRLSECIENENKTVGDRLIPDIEKYLVLQEGKSLINTENYFRYNIAKYYFVTGNYLQALDKLNEFLSSKLSKLTPEYESYSRILNILIHYELGNFSLLKHLIPSTKKYLTGKKKYFIFEAEIMRCIKKLIGLKDDAAVNRCFNDLFRKILMMKKDRFEKNAFVYFDPEKWIERKILLNK